MRWLWLVIALTLLLNGCATPVVPVTPVARGCQICRFIDTKGAIWFSECRLPPCIPTPGDGSCGDCCFSLPRHPGF